MTTTEGCIKYSFVLFSYKILKNNDLKKMIGLIAALGNCE